MSGVIDLDSLPQPGTQPFFPALLSCIRAAAPSLPLDPVVLQALLLCLLADGKNLILRTREEDIGCVSKLVASTLTSVFGYSTHKIKIHQDSKYQTPLEFLRSIFLHSSTPTPNSPNASDEFTNPSISSHKSKAMHKNRSGSRTSSVTMHPKLQRQSAQRSFSYPTTPVAPSIATISLLPDSGLFADQSRIQHTSSIASVKPNFQRPPLRPPGIQTDPAPLLTRRSSSEAAALPRALVISGLENAQELSQRALLKVLSDKSVTLDDSDGNWTCNLPRGFIVVYVCTADPRERPAIHKTLLDKFAMSTTINLHPSTQHAVRHMLAHQRFSFFQTTTLPSNTPTITPILSESLLKSLRSLIFAPRQFAAQPQTKIHPNLFLFISDLFSAVRHHPQLDATLLTARARNDVEPLVRAARVIGGDLTGAEFIHAMGKGAEARLETEENGSRDDGNVGGLDITTSWENGNGYSAAAAASLMLNEILDVSEADIARIVPRVLSHRLRVRDGPEDEILGSLQHVAVATCAQLQLEVESRDNGEKKGAWERGTVKDTLVKILAEV